MALSLKAKPNNTYYQMDKSSFFAEGGISRLQTPFLAKDFGKGVFLFMGENKNTSTLVPFLKERRQ